MITYYSICLVLASIIFMITIFFNVNKKINNLFVMLTLIMAISNFGYLSLALSETLEGAMFANKISYLGGCFISPVLLFLILRVCNFKPNKYLRFIAYGYSLFVYFLVLSTGYNTIYYKEQWIDKYLDSTILCQEYGPLHFTFLVIIASYVVINLGVLIYAILVKKSVAKKPIFILISLEIINVLMFFIGRIIIPEFEFMPLTYVINGVFLIFLKTRIDLYDVEDTIEKAYDDNNESGYIMFDIDLRYLGSNDIAKKIIPNLSDCRIDEGIEKLDCLAFLIDWIKGYINDEENNYRYDYSDRYYTCKISSIINNKKIRGYIIEFHDDTDRIKYIELVNKYSEDLEKEVYEKSQNILNIQNQVVLGMASVVENRDNSTGGHVRRTSDIIKIILDAIKENSIFEIDDILYNQIVRAAPMHDLGKIAISDNILNKPGRFTPEEYEIMKTHAIKSAELVEELLIGVETMEFVSVAKNIARYHHERWDGLGYPDKLCGNEIPLEARIMAIADVYDALVSKRCYKAAMSFEEAFDVMIQSMGTQFDPKMKEVMIACRERLENYYINNMS